MSDTTAADRTDDRYDLNRFVLAQAGPYEQALAEIRSGQKRSHWMWYVFPQFEGLGSSPISMRYAIKGIAEAREYLRHPVLGPRLTACAEALLAVSGRSAHDIFGSPDDMKLRSCATLFAHVSPEDSVFDQLLITRATARRCKCFPDPQLRIRQLISTGGEDGRRRHQTYFRERKGQGLGIYPAAGREHRGTQA